MSAYESLAAFYDELTRDVDYAAFADFYEQLFADAGLRVHSVLDAACGTGSLSAVLAGRGYDLICADQSEEMLAVAAEKLAEISAAEPPLLLCQPLESLDLYGTVDAEICSLDGMNYVPPEELDTVLHRLWLFLEPGGMLVFDVNTPEKLKAMDGEVFLDETEDVYCVWRAEVDAAANACVYGIDLFFARDGLWERAFEEHVEYIHTPDTLRERLLAAGFADVRLYGDRVLTAPRAGEQRVFFTARKPASAGQTQRR